MKSIQRGETSDFHTKIYWLVADYHYDPRLHLFENINITPVNILKNSDKRKLEELDYSVYEACKGANCKINIKRGNPKEFCARCKKIDKLKKERDKGVNDVRYKAFKSLFQELAKS